jgi:hypothetical protein
MVHFQEQFPNASDSNPSCHYQLQFNFTNIYLMGLASCLSKNLIENPKILKFNSSKYVIFLNYLNISMNNCFSQ